MDKNELEALARVEAKKMDYQQFLLNKERLFVASGFTPPSSNWEWLYPFQQHIVNIGLLNGRYAIWADCGLGKTRMQLTWAYEVARYTNKPVLILAPLTVVDQTIQEAKSIGIDMSNIHVNNYEQLDNIDCSIYSGVVLDESGILKNFSGATKEKIIERFANTPYKLACTATPSPNDELEIGNHAEFLNVMSSQDMRAIYFTTDKEIIKGNKYRLKNYAVKEFYKWISSWAIMLSKPSDIGFDMEGYNLPELKLIEHQVKAPKKDNGSLYNDISVSATTFNNELRITKVERLAQVAEIVNASPNDSFIIWIKHNDEGDALRELIPDSIEIKGSDSLEQKKFLSFWFTNQDNECICNTKEEKRNINQSTGQSTTQKTKNQSLSQHQKDLRKKENQTQNLDNQKLSTAKSTTQKTKINLESSNLGQKIEKTQEEGSYTHPIKSIENEQRKTQRNKQLETQEQYLKTELKNTGLVLNNTNHYCESKITNAQYAEANQPSLIQNKDCTSTIAIKQTKSEDCYAQTAIKELENSMIRKYCSTVQFCTCCGKAKRKIMVTKTKIMGFGINAQGCHNQVFASLDFSFETLYQAIRRSYRFGQKHSVNIYLITTDTMQNVIQSINEKQDKFIQMQDEMREAIMCNIQKPTLVNKEAKKVSINAHTIVLGDCVAETKKLPDNSIDYSFFSPPFGALYVFSNDLRDMSNVTNNQHFLNHFRYLVVELFRTIKPGRLCTIHMMQSTTLLGRDGYYSIVDFRGDLIRLFQDCGFHFHAENMIRKDPKTAAIRTKNRQLMWGTTQKDSAIVRPGLADYMLTFKKPGVNAVPINNNIPFDMWCKMAEPVWIDIEEGDTLEFRSAKDDKDERHLTPTQLTPIRWLLSMYSNKGDKVLSPFSGIASEGVVCAEMDRPYYGIELKESYFDISVKNMRNAESKKKQATLFNMA